MRGVGHAKLAAQGKRGQAHVVLGSREAFGHRNSAQEVANQAVELRVRDQVSSLLASQRASEHPRQIKNCLTAARQTPGRAVRADQLALNAKSGRLQGNEMNIAEITTVDRLAKHACINLARMGRK